jgi:ABC-type dipeptide/oligopeptide/nickel transport system ATPase component
MSELIGIVGESGTGKSTAVRTLDPKETAIISCIGKPLPIKGWKKNYTSFKGTEGNFFVSDLANEIIKCMVHISEKRKDIKNIVIDDWQYTMSNEYMKRASEKGFEKFTEIGRNAWSVLNKSKSLREDIKVFILTHSDTQPGEFGAPPVIKIKTIGKLLDDKINPAGLFSVLLYTDVNKKENGTMEYRFVTNNDGHYPAKSPMDMFKSLYISNDLGLVTKSMDEYYG